MINPEEIIENLSTKLKPIFGGVGFHKSSTLPITYGLQCGYCSEAITKGEEVKIINLFDNYWVHLKIIFTPYSQYIHRKEITNYYVMFTLSVFYGEFTSKSKQQLFRAEWDNYPLDEGNHPQPHWHFYMEKDKNNLDNSFSEVIETSESGFIKMIQHNNKEFNKMHFAMNGQWGNEKGHFHKIENSDDFVTWVFGLLEHIKMQLRYIEKH